MKHDNSFPEHVPDIPVELLIDPDYSVVPDAWPAVIGNTRPEFLWQAELEMRASEFHKSAAADVAKLKAEPGPLDDIFGDLGPEATTTSVAEVTNLVSASNVLEKMLGSGSGRARKLAALAEFIKTRLALGETIDSICAFAAAHDQGTASDLREAYALVEA